MSFCVQYVCAILRVAVVDHNARCPSRQACLVLYALLTLQAIADMTHATEFTVMNGLSCLVFVTVLFRSSDGLNGRIKIMLDRGDTFMAI